MSVPNQLRDLLPPDVLSDEHLLVALTGYSAVRGLVEMRAAGVGGYGARGEVAPALWSGRPSVATVGAADSHGASPIVLAVKLHFKRRPFIGKGSYWIPVTTWKVARDQIRTWLHLLTSSEGGTGRRDYITLAKIPEDHLVWMGIDWIGFNTERPVPLSEVPDWIKAEIMIWYDHENQHFKNHWVGSKNCYAQVRLEEPLPPRCVKWTKDIRLLYRGDKRRRRQRPQP